MYSYFSKQFHDEYDELLRSYDLNSLVLRRLLFRFSTIETIVAQESYARVTREILDHVFVQPHDFWF